MNSATNSEMAGFLGIEMHRELRLNLRRNENAVEDDMPDDLCRMVSRTLGVPFGIERPCWSRVLLEPISAFD